MKKARRRGRKRRGALLYPVARDTGRVLLGLRSRQVAERPGAWAGFGGGAEGDETLADCALRELREETGYGGPIALLRVAHNVFIGLVPEEFPPLLNWEHENARWFTPTELGWPDLTR